VAQEHENAGRRGHGAGFSHPQPAPELRTAVERAFEIANHSKHAVVTDAHLAAALFDDAVVQAALEACGVDLENASDVALGTAAEAPKRGWYQLWLRESADYVGAIQRAFLHAASSELEVVAPLFVLVQIVSPASKSKFAARADAIGIERESIRWYSAHGRVGDPPLAIDPGRRYHVVVSNDPFTTREFVVKALGAALDLPEDRAVEAMLAIHRGTELRFGPFDAATAARKVETLRSLARAERFPFGVDAVPAGPELVRSWPRKG
jgi:ATP-dependent Clp protease adapter protein ClpS